VGFSGGGCRAGDRAGPQKGATGVVDCLLYLCIFCIVDVDFLFEVIIKIALVWRLKSKYKKFVRVFSFLFLIN